MTEAELRELIDGIAPVIKSFVETKVEQVAGRVAEVETRLSGLTSDIERRVATIERRPELTFEGVYQNGKHYRPGALVVNGGLWLAQRETQQVPGDGLTAWKLVLKGGRS